MSNEKVEKDMTDIMTNLPEKIDPTSHTMHTMHSMETMEQDLPVQNNSMTDPRAVLDYFYHQLTAPLDQGGYGVGQVPDKIISPTNFPESWKRNLDTSTLVGGSLGMLGLSKLAPDLKAKIMGLADNAKGGPNDLLAEENSQDNEKKEKNIQQ